MKLYDAVSRCIRISLETALRQSNGNVTHAARLLGIHRTHLYKLAAEHGARMPNRERPLGVMHELANWRRA